MVVGAGRRQVSLDFSTSVINDIDWQGAGDCDIRSSLLELRRGINLANDHAEDRDAPPPLASPPPHSTPPRTCLETIHLVALQNAMRMSYDR